MADGAGTAMIVIDDFFKEKNMRLSETHIDTSFLLRMILKESQ
jgi:hypothetical protein